MTKQIKNFKKENEAEYYFNVLLSLIETRELPYRSVQLEGILKCHIRYCTKPSEMCLCRFFSASSNEEDDEVNNNSLPSLALEDTSLRTRRWFTFLLSLIDDVLDKFPRSPSLHLLHAFIL